MSQNCFTESLEMYYFTLAQEFNYDIVPFAALGGDEVFELGFDASVIVEHRWFKQLLKIQKHPKYNYFLSFLLK